MKKRKIVESELKQPIWAIVTPDRVLAMNLTYAQAEQKIMHIDDSGATITLNSIADTQLDLRGKIQ